MRVRSASLYQPLNHVRDTKFSLFVFSPFTCRTFSDFLSFVGMFRVCPGNSKFENGLCECNEGFVRVLGTRYCRELRWSIYRLRSGRFFRDNESSEPSIPTTRIPPTQSPTQEKRDFFLVILFILFIIAFLLLLVSYSTDILECTVCSYAYSDGKCVLQFVSDLGCQEASKK